MAATENHPLAEDLRTLISDLEASVPVERREPLKRWQTTLSTSIRKHIADPEEQKRASVADRQGLGVSRRRSVA